MCGRNMHPVTPFHVVHVQRGCVLVVHTAYFYSDAHPICTFTLIAATESMRLYSCICSTSIEIVDGLCTMLAALPYLFLF